LDLFRALPDVKFVDAAPLLWELRMKKSGEEIALMREAAKITAKARQKTFDLIHAGDTQREIARTFGQMMLRYGADRVAFVHVGTREPVNLTQFHSDKPVARGEMLYLDGGAYLRSHTIDYPRLATIGAASKKQVASHEAIRRVCREMVEVVKPGTNCSEIWRVGHRAIREAGFATFDVGRTGHGQGMLSTEPPSISSDDKTVLVPGMVLGIEPFTMQGDVPIIWEDVYAVTDDGADRLTLESEELREI
jgi:Xaa-Pro dipeptidase